MLQWSFLKTVKSPQHRLAWLVAIAADAFKFAFECEESNQGQNVDGYDELTCPCSRRFITPDSLHEHADSTNDSPANEEQFEPVVECHGTPF